MDMECRGTLKYHAVDKRNRKKKSVMGIVRNQDQILNLSLKVIFCVGSIRISKDMEFQRSGSVCQMNRWARAVWRFSERLFEKFGLGNCRCQN